jgi:hypothetical protein
VAAIREAGLKVPASAPRARRPRRCAP